MTDIRKWTGDLAEIMNEYGLSEAEIQGDGFKVAFRRRPIAPLVAEPAAGAVHYVSPAAAAPIAAPEPAAPAGMPITTPMAGIYYAAPSPNAPPFVREGDTVEAGQVVALIEAMKVFNEIVAPMSGTVKKLVYENGTVVNPGDALLYVG